MLALFAPGPRPIVLGGQTWQARPLRVGDVFQLGLFAAETVPDPLEGINPDDPESLRAAYDAAELWPPNWSVSLTTLAGQMYVVSAVLRDHAPSVDTIIELIGRMTENEWRILNRVAFGGDPALIVHRIIDDQVGADVIEDSCVSWPKAVAEMCAAYHYRPSDVMEMTFPELVMLRSGGERKLVPVATAEGQAARKAFWRPDGGAGMPNAVGPVTAP